MFRRNLAFISVLFGFGIAAVACGSDDGGSKGSTGGGSGTTDETGPGAQPPEGGGGSTGSGTTPTVLAVKKLYLGETNKSGSPDPNGWESFGYNLDNLFSTKTGSNHCKLPANTPPSNKVDGKDGIDNSFGKNILAILKTFIPAPSDEVNQNILDGGFTIMLRLDNLDSEANQTGITASLYGGADLGGPPNWDGNDMWPVFPELLNNGDINDPKVKFPNSYVSGGTWVSGSKGTVDLSVSVGGKGISLVITNAVITMDITGTGTSASATNGVISGVIKTTQLTSEIEKIAGDLTSGQLCPGNPTLEGALVSIRQASDIMSDGTNGDSAKECDAISVGIGFEASAVQLGAVAPPATGGGGDPCVDGGAGAGGTGGTAGTGGSSGSAGSGGAGGASDAGAD
ncbi:MAG: hypothetical protein R3B13_22330 [Polyangiaceae bacterium]